MIYVTSVDSKQVEPLTQFNNFKMEQEVNGTFSVSFTSFNLNNPAHSILHEESVITVDDFDFNVKQLKENRTSKNIVGVSTFFDLNDSRKDEIYGGTHTFNEFMSFVLDGSGWSFTFDNDINHHKIIPNFGEANVIALVNVLCSTFQCEYEIRPNNQVHFSHAIGGDNDAQYRYKHNIKALHKNVDTTKLKTFIKGYGANELMVSYTSPNASVFGVREADPISDDNLTESDSLLEKLKNELMDYPEAYFELDAVELTDKALGERVWLIYEPLKIEFQTRVLSQTKEFRTGKLVTTKVILGNTLPKSTDDLLVSQKVEIDENRKEYRSKFEQTNDRITMEVEEVNGSIAQLEIKADEINLSVNNRITDEMAAINIKADNINLSVNNRITNEVSTINQRADQIELKVEKNESNVSTLTIQAGQIESRVTNLDGRMGTAESRITQTDQRITLETRGDNLISSINVAPYGVTVNADKINLNGAVIASGSITGHSSINIATDATVGNNLYLGQGFGSKSLVFNNSNRINASGYGMDLNAQQITLSSSDITIGTSSYSRTGFNGTVDFSYANVLGVALAHSQGIGISYSGGYLYVKVNGSTVGSVKLT
ncbi:prophage endopeptidase tail family protein [Lysinibacillus fusiformis]|uniref:prophage endopeptidase tail family protein n=1 Tax=Lysinibacillus fusiformis TaxID=28031 RepID=UPI0004694409|nr:prophage endopeptidase tail family protein [Lysinibacillus fusiformis]